MFETGQNISWKLAWRSIHDTNNKTV